MPDFTYDDLASTIRGLPNEHMVTEGGAMGADILPKRPLGDLTRMASIPPWLLPIIMAIGFRGRGGNAPNIPARTPQATPQRPQTEIGNLVRGHFGQDNVNPATGRSEFNSDPFLTRLGVPGRAMPNADQLRQTSYFDSVTPQSFPGFRTRGQQAASPNMRAQSFNPLVENMNRGFDRLANRSVLTPANRTPNQSYNLASMLQALRGKPEGQ